MVGHRIDRRRAPGNGPPRTPAGDRLWETVGIAEPHPPRPAVLPSGYERTLPPEVQLVVRARRRALARRASGRVLDLGGAETHHTMWSSVPVGGATVLDGVADARLASLARAEERFDTIVSVFQLAAASDLDATARRLGSMLTDDGRVLFLEPGRLSGLPGRVQRLVAPPVGLLTGWRVDRNVPMSLRESGLSVTDLDRHRIPTIQWWLRSLVEGSAHRALPLSPRGPGA